MTRTALPRAGPAEGHAAGAEPEPGPAPLPVTALIADDEPLLRDRLTALLAQLWPELVVVAQARNGGEVLERFEQYRPRIVFLDVKMPGMNGIEAGRSLARRAELVFVTAFNQYAIEAFEQGAIDYLLKPVDPARLAATVSRLRERLRCPPVASVAPADELANRLERLAQRLRLPAPPSLRWIKASVGATVRLIPVDQVIYLKSDNKYTLVVWDGGEALIRRSIREMADALDPERFAQVHRSAIVGLDRVSHFSHGPGDGGELHLKGRPERLLVSRSYLHLFQQM